MTAATLFQVMSVTTANIVTVTTVRSAQPIVRCVIPRFAWAVRTNVPHVTSRFAGSALQHARTVKRRFARTV